MTGMSIYDIERAAVAYLQDRLDEDEATAHAATDTAEHDPRWRRYGPTALAGPDIHKIRTVSGNRPIAITQDASGDDQVLIVTAHAVAEHIARWDPARVLAEVAAKRAIISLWVQADEHRAEHVEAEALAWYADRVIMAMVQSYVGRSDFDPAWKLE